MSVASILQALAENAGQAQLRKGAIYGNLARGVAQVPAQIIDDREKDALRARSQAMQDEQLGFQRNADTRATSDQAMQEKTAALAEQRKAAVSVGLSAAMGESGDPAKFDAKAAFKAVSDLGQPDAIRDVIAAHQAMQPKLLEHDLTKALLDPANPAGPPVVAPVAKPDVPTEASLTARQIFLRSKQKTGVTVTPAEQAEIDSFTELKAPKTRTGEDQALDAFAKSLKDSAKTKAEDLTYEDRQAFERNKAAITASAQFQNHMRERTFDNAHPAPVKAADQNKLEQEYRTVLTRGLSSRSGGLGAEDAKVQQANHLISLLDQNYDPKTDTYNVPHVQQTELAMGLAKLVSPGGVVAQKTVDDINQATAKGDLAKALTYVTGTPFNGTTQDLVKMYRDSILRQGQTAMENREGEMRYLRGLAPTDLAEDRRKALEANTLNPLRQSRVATDAQGNRKLFVSIDGGVTWK